MSTIDLAPARDDACAPGSESTGRKFAYGLCVGVILAFGASLILTYGGMLLHRRELTPGELMIFMTYLGIIYDPLCQMTGFRFNLESGLAGARRVFEVLDRDAVVIDSAGATSLPLQPRSLILEAVAFEYSSEQKILQRIDVKIEAGQSVAFVGSSGAGKSTLLNLLLRFYDPTAGIVKLDQYDLRQIKLKDVRRMGALVRSARAKSDPLASNTAVTRNCSGKAASTPLWPNSN